MLRPSVNTVAKRGYFTLFIAAVFCTTLYHLCTRSNSIAPLGNHRSNSAISTIVEPVAQYFIDYPLDGPNYRDQFGELGKRVQLLTSWILASHQHPKDHLLKKSIESVSESMFPFIKNTSNPDNLTPLTSLKNSYVPGSTGIVVPVGVKNFRFACHLIFILRTVLHSKLPIQIAYAGDGDLPLENRKSLLGLVKDIQFLDVLSVLDDESMALDRSWAIKPFAVLASTFEKLILLDADIVFLQPPETLLSRIDFQETGALFFHDRLLWQGAFPERHEWWQEQMKHQKPTKALLSSLVWTENYAEEADSGVVILDKSRLQVFTGLLHICWQNTKAVREEATYTLTYGDKESWWFGLDLCGVPHSFEKHYGAVLGEIQVSDDGEEVCGFTIAHVDDEDRLIWYNGSLLKNKAVDQEEFMVPEYWMVDAEWEKGEMKSDMSCMKGGVPVALTTKERDLLRRSVEVAKKVDAEISLLEV